MNFLAHIYLSGEDEGLKTGNFIGDYVKGNKYLNYPDQISAGIILHRNIDTFTDNHPVVKSVSELFRPTYARYSGIIVDMVFDHFLAKQWHHFSEITLKEYARNAHSIFLSNFRLLPSKVKQFLPFLIHHRRLESYSTVNGLQKALELMSKYTSLPSAASYAVQILDEHEHIIQKYFYQFMNEIINYVEIEFSIEIKRPSVISKPLSLD